MKLLEYEAKNILAAHGLPVPKSGLMRNADETPDVAFPVVLKVQIPKGGRGKAGGIKTVNDAKDLQSVAAGLLSKPVLDCEVKALLAEETVEHERELYLAVVVDRISAGLVLLARRQGGVEVEQSDDELLRVPLAGMPDQGLADKLADFFSLPEASQPLLGIISGLYETAVKEDALLVEVNPLMVRADGGLVCADAKIELDDAAGFRHQEWQFEHVPASSQFVVLNSQGTIASMANGAGLAMATVDAIKAAGAEPANFYDVGGGTNVEGMVRAFQKIADIGQVRAIVVNIFGGITRCDEVAQAIVEARKRFPALPKLYIRLTGTNEAEGRDILEAAGISLYPTLAACVEEAVKP